MRPIHILARATLLTCALLLPTLADASSITSGSKVRLLSSTGTLGGGPFKVDGPDPGSTFDFLTFCIEINEFVSYNTDYFANIALVARDGGAGGPDPDPLDSRTAYLYSKFTHGTLAGYDASDSNARDGLQLAVWRLEDEVYRDGATGKYKRTDTNAVVGNLAMWSKADLFFNDANTNAVAGNLYGVAIMQLWTSYNPTTKTFSGNKQDQLIYVSEPAPLAGLLIGVLALAIMRMRF